MACTIYFVRHGETYWNAERKMQGQCNIPLNEKGREQAGLVAEQLKEIVFDVAYTSPLSRARDTAEIILHGTNTPIISSDLLIEQAYGLSEAASQDGFMDPNSPIYGYSQDPVNYKPDIGGESFEQLRERADKVIHQILLPLEQQYRNVLVTAHGAILCSIFGRVQRLEIKDFWKPLLPNCGIGCMKLEEGRLIV